MTFTRVGSIVLIAVAAAYFGNRFLLTGPGKEQVVGQTPVPAQESGNATSAVPAAASGPAAASPGGDAAPSQPQAASSTAAGSSPPASTAASAPGPSEEEARKAAEEIGRKVATQVAASVVLNSQPQPAVEQPVAESAPVASSADGASSGSGGAEPAPADAASPAPSAPAPAEPVDTTQAAAASAPAAPAEPSSGDSEQAKVASSDNGSAPARHAKASSRPHRGQPSMDVVSVWWPAVGKQSDSQLNLLYAGEAAAEKAAVLLFSDNIGSAATAATHIQILDSHGKPADGHWDVSPQNARMLIFATSPGRYTVILAAELAGLSGKTLGTELHGPVYVH